MAQTAMPDRMRIGLALSGGGARGAAHIGVLQVLEELRVPVDCIAGTSMGSVVGGAYAAGNTPQAMQALIAQTDWSNVFNDSPPRSELSARRKVDDYKGLFSPELGLRDGAIVMPRGVVAGVTIEGFLRQLAAPSSGIDDFSRLPIPYRAVAADIETGAEVVLARGSLMQAMRASMAIPGAVAPVVLDGRLLVDGGIANNLPIDVVRATCADVVIAVNIATPAMKREEISSALSVVGQLVNLLGKEKVDRQLAQLTPRDVLIEPQLGDISASSFERQLEAIEIGVRAARAIAPALARYSLPPEAYAALRRNQVAVAQPPAPIAEIRFEGQQRTNPEVLAQLIETRPGEPVDEQRLVGDLRRIYGRGDYESVDYRIEQSPAGRVLHFPVREKSNGPDYLRIGLGLASDFRDGSNFNLLASYRRTWLNSYGAEWLTEAQVGRVNQLSTEFYQPLERAGRWFVAPYARVSRGTTGIFVGDDRVAEYGVQERRVGVDAGLVLGTWGELRAGVLHRQVSAQRTTGLPGYPSLDVGIGGARLQLIGDTLDAPWFPHSGRRLFVGVFASTDTAANQPNYRRLDARWSGAASFGAHTLALNVDVGGGLGTRLPPYEGFTLGGPLRLSGYRIGRFGGEQITLAALRYYNQQVRLPSILGSGTYVGASLEAGRVKRLYSGEADTGTLWSGSLYVAAETFLGPAYVGVGLAPGGRRSLYLLIGAP